MLLPKQVHTNHDMFTNQSQFGTGRRVQIESSVLDRGSLSNLNVTNRGTLQTIPEVPRVTGPIFTIT